MADGTKPPANKPNAPRTIPVKKPDGTIVHLTLDEIKKMKAAPAGVSTGPSDVEKIIKGLSFVLSGEKLKRLAGAIHLYLKDVREANHTQAMLQREESEGGLGLTEEQADEVMRACAIAKGIGLPSIPRPVKPIGTEVFTSINRAQPPRSASRPKRPVEVRPPAPKPPTLLSKPPALAKSAVSVTAPLKPTASSAPSKPIPPSDIRNPKSDLRYQIPEPAHLSFRLTPTITGKPSLQDVTAPTMSQGPLEEIQYFTLTDFRRLATDPAEAARRLRQKFINLKEESIVLYLDALAAWRLSPLYRGYIDLVLKALAQKQRLASVLTDKANLQLPEFNALAAMSKQLRF